MSGKEIWNLNLWNFFSIHCAKYFICFILPYEISIFFFLHRKTLIHAEKLIDLHKVMNTGHSNCFLSILFSVHRYILPSLLVYFFIHFKKYLLNVFDILASNIVVSTLDALAR